MPAGRLGPPHQRQQAAHGDGRGPAPEWGKTDPYAMGAACVDECVRQLVAAGADPERLAILDNFCWAIPTRRRSSAPSSKR